MPSAAFNPAAQFSVLLLYMWRHVLSFARAHIVKPSVEVSEQGVLKKPGCEGWLLCNLRLLGGICLPWLHYIKRTGEGARVSLSASESSTFRWWHLSAEVLEAISVVHLYIAPQMAIKLNFFFSSFSSSPPLPFFFLFFPFPSSSKYKLNRKF